MVAFIQLLVMISTYDTGEWCFSHALRGFFWKLSASTIHLRATKEKKIMHQESNSQQFFVTLKEINLLLNFFGFSIVYNEVIIHFSVGRSDGYIPCRSAAQ